MIKIATAMDTFCGSEFWNSNLSWYTDDPDFTKCFEETVLAWIPCVFLWTFSGLELYYILTSKKRDIPWNWFNLLKLFCIGVLFLLTFGDLVAPLKSASLAEKELFNVNIYTPIIKLFTFALAAILTIYNRKYGLVTSGVLFLFWLLEAVCGAFQLRSEVRNSNSFSQINYIVFYTFVLITLLLNCFADRPPKKSSFPKLKNPCPEENSSFLSRLFFAWFDPLAWRGFKKPLVESDLWNLKHEDSANAVVPAFERHWRQALNKNNYDSSVSFKQESVNVHVVNKDKPEASVLPAILKAFGSTFTFGAFLKLFYDVLVFVGPIILSRLIEYVQGDEQKWKGLMYSILLLIAGTAQTVLLAQYNNKMYIVGLRIRTALTAAIYKKALRISNRARKEGTVGEMVNFMSVDAQKLVDIVPYINMIWSAPLQIILALYFLWRILGPAVLAGVGVMIILIPINGYIANKITLLQIEQMTNKDKRVKLINEILNGIKVLKLYAWEPSFERQVLDVRGKEIKMLKGVALFNSGLSFIWACAPYLVTLTTFAVFVYSDSSNILTVQVAFVSLSLFSIMNLPMSLLPLLLVFCAETWVSLKRINKFMNSEELDPSSVTHDPRETTPLTIENGFFNWDEDAILKDINLQLDFGSLTAVVGPVGSGKSSLLSAFLGEMVKISGRVNTVGKIAYVSQEAWIQNATLRDNILFGNEFEQNRYEEIIEACALKEDLPTLSAGDQTEIGEKGINLSGGQRQRISLARAVYSDCDVYFLDDPLSAVDSQVGKHIFEQVIGPEGLLKDKTRIVVTHGVTYLPRTDKIVVLKDGEVAESGSYQQLLERKGDFSEFLKQHVSEVKEDDVPESDQASKKKEEKEDVKETEGDTLIEEEKAERGHVKLVVYKHYFQSIGVLLSLATIIFFSIFQAFSIGSNIWLGIWANDPTAVVNGTVDPSKRDYYLGIYGALGLGQAIAIVFASFALYIGGLNSARVLHNLLLSKIMKAPCTTFFDVTPIGRILNRFAKDIDVLDNILPLTLRGWCACFFSVLGTIVVISYTTPIFLSIVLPVGIVYFFIQRFYVATSRQLNRMEAISRSPIYSHFQETVSGVQSIRAFKQQQRFIKESERKVDNNQICNYPTIISNTWLSVRLEMIGNLITFFTALFAVLEEDQDPGLVGLSIAYSLQVTQSLSWLVRMTSDIETSVVAVERIKEYESAPQEASWNVSKKIPSSSWPETGSVTFSTYSVKYRPGLDLVLKDINCVIHGGEKIGIVGRTGAGKSSLTLSLFRIIESSGGQISIDGLDISQLGLHVLRSSLTIIPQDAVLFSGTLRMNLDPYGKHSDEEIWTALDHAHLKSFVKGFTAGLHHEVSEGGDNFSVGQRQLICLSRALLRKTKILIMDEATAAVDLETDDLIQKTIRREFGNCTILTIAHRLNTIMDSDRVLVLDKGRIAEFDAPNILLKKQSSIFYGMCKDAGLV